MATEDTETPDAVALAQAAKIAGGLRDVRYGEDAGAGAEASGASEPAVVGFEGAGISATALDALVEQLSRGEVPQAVISEADVQGLIEGLLAKCAAKGIPESELAEVIAEIRGNIGASREHLGFVRESAHRGVEHVVAEAVRLKTERAIEQMNALHKDLYANDAVYRAATDENRKQTDKALSELDEKLGRADKWAEEKGYKTDFDDAEKKARQAYEEAKASGNDLEALEKLREWVEIRRQQNEDRIKQTKAAGDSEGEALYRQDTKTALDAAQDKFKNIFEKQLKDLLEAEGRRLDGQNRNPQEKEDRLKDIEKHYRTRAQSAGEKKDNEKTIIDEMAKAIESAKESPVIRQTAQLSRIADEKTQPATKTEMPTELPALPVVHVADTQSANLAKPLSNLELPELPGLPSLKG